MCWYFLRVIIFVINCLLFCKFKYLFSKLQEKNVKISVFSEKNTIFCGFLSDFGVKTPGKLQVFREMADSEVIVPFLHVIAHNFLSVNWGTWAWAMYGSRRGEISQRWRGLSQGRMRETLGSAKDGEGSAKDGWERHWDQPRTAEPAG